jgi:pyruvate dehydrogenase E2 component (dihydrolipoamide acetyltransferase)
VRDVAVAVIVPEVGEAGMEVTFVGWLRADGDRVIEGEEVFEVDTTKAEIAVEAVASGVLHHLDVVPGDVVNARQQVGWIGEPGETPPARPSPDMASVAEPPSTSPRAIRLAAELGVDLRSLRGSGPDGLIVAADVEAAGAATASAERYAGRAVLTEEQERVRQGTAALTTRSWLQVPHFHLCTTLDVTVHLQRWRPTSLLLAAATGALRAVPELNRQWRGEDLLRTDRVDVGLLVHTARGLLLPRLVAVDQCASAEDFDVLVGDAAERARRGVLRPDDHGPRSFTLSNLGMFAVDRFAGVIAAPDTMLISCGRIRTEPRWQSQQWQPRQVVDVTVTMDHRAYDGADGGRLIDAMQDLLGAESLMP